MQADAGLLPGGSLEQALVAIFGIVPGTDSALLRALATPSLLGSMSHIINGVALTAATVLILWSSLSAVAGTAHEGRLFGRHYHSMWVPLRSAVSVAMLLPVVQGYSLIQIGVLMLASISFGAADTAWRVALDHLRNTGPIINVSPAHSNELVVALFRSSICMERMNALHFQGKMADRVVLRQRDTVTFGGHLRYSLEFDGGRGSWLGSGVCGKVSITYEDTAIGQAMYQGSRDALHDVWRGTHRLAVDYLRTGQWEQTATGLLRQKREYDARIRRTASHALSRAEGAMEQANREFFAAARESGWIVAGAWFWNLGAVNRRIADTVQNVPLVQRPSRDQLPADWQAELDQTLSQLNRRLSLRDEPGGNSGIYTRQDGLHGKLLSWMRQPMTLVLQYVNELFNGNGEPMISLQSFGHGMINVAQQMIAGAALGEAMGRGALQGVSGNLFAQLADRISLGGGKLEFVSAVGSTLLEWASLIMGTLSVPIFFAGLMFAFWLPAAPFVYWFVGVVGWLIFLLEAVLIAPLWAAAHASAEGEGFASYYSRPGYIVVLTLVGRPLMMVLGLFAAMFITHFGSQFLLLGFAPFAAGMHIEHVVGIISIIAMLIILVILITAMINRAYALIYMLPERIFEYISDLPGVGSSQTASGSASQFMTDMNTGRHVAADAISRVADSPLASRMASGSANTAPESDGRPRPDSHHPGTILAVDRKPDREA